MGWGGGGCAQVPSRICEHALKPPSLSRAALSLVPPQAATAVMSARQGGLLSSFGDDAAGSSGLRLTKVQVGLVALARQLKYKLDDIAQGADTNNSAGLQALLQGACPAAGFWRGRVFVGAGARGSCGGQPATACWWPAPPCAQGDPNGTKKTQARIQSVGLGKRTGRQQLPSSRAVARTARRLHLACLCMHGLDITLAPPLLLARCNSPCLPTLLRWGGAWPACTACSCIGRAPATGPGCAAPARCSSPPPPPPPVACSTACRDGAGAAAQPPVRGVRLPQAALLQRSG